MARRTKAELQLDNLRAKRDALLVENEIATLEREKNAEDLISRQVVESWGDTVNTREYLFDTPGWHWGDLGNSISRPEDRLDGDFAPFFKTESEHSMIRGVARVIATTDEIAQGALKNLTNYVVGSSLSVDVSSDTHPQLASQAQKIVDRFLSDNDFVGDFDREFFRMSREDGEAMSWIRHVGSGRFRLEQIEPDFVTEPVRPEVLEEHFDLPPGLSWKYGVATDSRDTSHIWGYFVRWFGSEQDWDFVPADEMLHVKCNVPRRVKRGVSDFYSVWQNLQRAEKLLGNTLQGGAVQAAIAFIREHASGVTEAQVKSIRTNATDRKTTRPNESGGRTVHHQKFEAGTIVDTRAGQKYHAGPLGGKNATNYIEILQAAYRTIGARFSMPEYMISGDASNGNYASSLVSESPFVKESESLQQVYRSAWIKMLLRVLRIAAEHGHLHCADHEIDDCLDVDVMFPDVAVRDRKTDHEIRRDEHERGLLSLETWAQETGRDIEIERAKGAKATSDVEVDVEASVAGVDDSADVDSQDVAGDASDVDDAARQTATLAAVTLNGAQVTAATAIVAAVAAGEIPRDSGVAQIASFFGLSTDEAEKIIGSAGLTPPKATTTKDELAEAARRLWIEDYP